MLTWEDDVEVHALHKQGWTIAAIARHVGRDRKTVRAYLNGNARRGPGNATMTRSSRSWPISARGWSRIRICGR